MRVDDEKATQLKQRLSPFGALTAHMEQEICGSDSRVRVASRQMASAGVQSR